MFKFRHTPSGNLIQILDKNKEYAEIKENDHLYKFAERWKHKVIGYEIREYDIKCDKECISDGSEGMTMYTYKHY